jgi:flagellar basal body-associated protein FliL
MAEEEVLGEEEPMEEEGEEEEGEGGGVMDFAGGMFSSFVVKVLLGAIGLVAVVLMVVFITYWTSNTLLMGSQPDQEGQVSQEQPGTLQQSPMQTYALENDFIITKQDPRGRTRTLKLKIVLAFNSENAGVQGELKKREPQIRDLIYGELGSMRVEKMGYENKQEIQDRLVSEINKILTSGNRIQDVYFSDYVFQ